MVALRRHSACVDLALQHESWSGSVKVFAYPWGMTENNIPSSQPLGSMPHTASASYAKRSPVLAAFDRFASSVTRWAGSPAAFCVAIILVVVWAAVGPIFGFSENWQLVINTGTTIITFLMVFLIQQSQNKDSVAMHLKLNELLAASQNASNRMVGIEDLDEQALRELADFYVRPAKRAKEQGAPKGRHSIDEESEVLSSRRDER